jgi:hypothetical protein
VFSFSVNFLILPLFTALSEKLKHLSGVVSQNPANQQTPGHPKQARGSQRQVDWQAGGQAKSQAVSQVLAACQQSGDARGAASGRQGHRELQTRQGAI